MPDRAAIGSTASSARRGWPAGIAALGLALSASLVLAAGAHGAGWLAPVDLSAPQTRVYCGAFCVQPGAGGVDVAVDPQGNAIAAWTRRDDVGSQVVQAAFRPAGGSFGPAQDLGTTTTDYGFPEMSGALADVAMDAAGNATVVWPHPTGTGPVVQAASRPAGGSFGPPAALSGAGQSVRPDPRIATSPSGHAIVVWAVATTGLIEAASRSPGGAFAAAQPLSLGGQIARDARVAVNDLGAAVVTWVRSNGSNEIVQARVRPAAGAFGPIQDLSAPGQNAFSPQAAIDAQGRSTVIWSRANGLGDVVVQARALTAAGAPASGADDVSEPGRDGASPQVALDAANTAVAVWHGCPTGAASNCVVESAARPSGGSFGSVQSVAAAEDVALPAIAVSPAGDGLAVWSSSALGRIQAAARPKGGAFGEPESISPSVGEATNPALALGPGGGALAAWAHTRPPPDGDLQLAQAAALDPGTIAPAPPAATATVTPAAPPAATAPDRLRRLEARIAARWSVRGSRTTVKRLAVGGLPANARVRLRCHGRRCPFGTRRAANPRRGRLNLLGKLGRERTLRAGQALEVRITAPPAIGEVARYRIRRGKRPALRTLCLPPGAAKPERC